MSEKTNVPYILSVLNSIEKIGIYSEDLNTAQELWEANRQMNLNGCQTLLIHIGEQIKKIDTKSKNKFPDIEWFKINHFRNRLAHDYQGVDITTLFKIIRNEIPDLKAVMLELLSMEKVEREMLEEIVATEYYKYLQYLLEE